MITIIGISGQVIIRWYFIPQLPSTENLINIQLQTPLRIYTKDGKFITEYGKQRRIPLTNIPQRLINAILAAEDDRFYQHQGVDLKSLFRAAFNLIKTGKKQQGGSTITMQLARNFFLSYEKTYDRKFKEILLAQKIEDELTKEDILRLYLNKIFFGYRAYGVGAAAQVYYGKDVRELTIAECAMLAALPKAPSINNPINKPKKAIERRNYILKRMLMLKYIQLADYNEAIAAGNTATLHQPQQESDALYVAEMVRHYLINKFGQQAVTNGYKVYTTIDSNLQDWANIVVRDALLRHDIVHGYRGRLGHIDIAKDLTGMELTNWANKQLRAYSTVDRLIPSLVLKVKRKSIEIYNKKAGYVKISWSGLSWARKPRRSYPKRASSIVQVGDIIMARPIKKFPKDTTDIEIKDFYHKLVAVDFKFNEEDKVSWRLSQVPKLEAALISMQANNGAITSLVGGFNFYNSKFNRVTQGKRQPGSAFKPFIYSAAMAKGYSPKSSIHDVAFIARNGWKPKNYTNKYYGWVSLRNALAYSLNVSTVKLLKQVGVNYTINHLAKFGFNPKTIPRNLTISLGSAEVTPLKLTQGFAVFANGGFKVKPYFIERIEDTNGKIIYAENPWKVCKKCSSELLASNEEFKSSNTFLPYKNCSLLPHYAPRAITSNNAYLMNSMLKDVIRIGTGNKALKLKNKSLGGKTGTTSNLYDVWFAGYAMNKMVTTVWMGFDMPRRIARRATGGGTALPLWMNFMQVALSSKPVKALDYYTVAHKAVKSKLKAKLKKKSSSSKKKPSIMLEDPIF
ncbi:MAG: PBP1A family penicillin-binding protein [Thiomargarita sp.]|nr:PBP1A family penicillin-binding protein [Thiomargarita sp.]